MDLDLDFCLDSCQDDFSIEEFDIDFEFDAPRFFDFSKPQQVDSETQESQLWFELESSGNYPPSPLSFKLSWRYDSKPIDISNSIIPTSEIDKGSGYIYYNQTVKEVPKTKTTRFLSNYSTLSRPTVSFLARQNKPLDIYSVQLLRRCQRSLGNFDDKISSLLFSMVQNQDTKRQKLETGFFRKVSRLDQTPFVHKVPRKVSHVSSSSFRCKVTVPREPNLKTAERAARRRYKAKSAPEQVSKWTSTASKRQTTNKSVQETCSKYLPKMNTPPPQDFQAFHLRTSLRAREHFSTAKNAPTDDAAPSQASKSVNPTKARKVKESCTSKKKFQVNESMIFPQDTKEYEARKGKYFVDEPFLESLGKLCLTSNTDGDINIYSKAHTSAAEPDPQDVHQENNCSDSLPYLDEAPT